MNPAFTTYTPRVREFEYDALRGAPGCQTITGNDYFEALAFVEICITDRFDVADSKFLKPRNVSYALGPVTVGAPEATKFATDWAAWTATSGVRIGKYSSITPPANALGAASPLWPTTKPAVLSLAFGEEAKSAIAIESAGSIFIKRYGASDVILTANFAGDSPVLFSTALTRYEVDPAPLDYSDLVCYYLRTSPRNAIYARFSGDNFATEYTINENLPADLEYLISASVTADFEVSLLAKTDTGGYAELTSPSYSVQGGDATTVAGSLTDGIYFASIEASESITEDATSIRCSLTAGGVAEVAKTAILTTDVTTLETSITSGLYE